MNLKRELSTNEPKKAERHKEMLNILSYQRNAHQNNSEIPSYTYKNGQD